MLGLRLFVQMLLALLCIVSVNAKSATGDRVLVIHEEDSIQSAFSQFFDSLKGIFSPLGYQVQLMKNRSKISIDVFKSKA
jgi:hypothetical protein